MIAVTVFRTKDPTVFEDTEGNRYVLLGPASQYIPVRRAVERLLKATDEVRADLGVEQSSLDLAPKEPSAAELGAAVRAAGLTGDKP